MRVLSATLLALLAACGAEPPPPDVPGRTVHAALLDPGPNVSDRRSQDSGEIDWGGDQDLLFVPMRRPVPVSARIFEDGGTTALPDVCLFLDTVGALSDLARSSDSTGNWGYGVVPGVYDALVAPGCLVGDATSLVQRDLEINAATPAAPLTWTLPPALPMRGRVLGGAGQGIAGAVVTVYRTDAPDLPVGLSATTTEDGRFSFSLPQGFYDLTVSTPWSGGVPIPPLISRNRPLPPAADVEVGLNVPLVSTATVRGALQDGSGNLLGGRVRLEGDIRPIGFPVEYPGGTFRAEFDTDGEWEIELPAGLYTATSFPPHPGLDQEQTLGIATADFVVSPSTGSPDDVALVYSEPRLGRVVVRDPSGATAAAAVELRMTSPPHYAYQLLSGADGVVVASLIPGLYDVEVIPATAADGTKRYARGHGQLDLREANAKAEIQLPRSDVYEGVVVTSDQGQIGSMRVILRDPETGLIMDDALSDDTERFRGFFRGVLPRGP